MGISRHLTARDLAGQPDQPGDYLHYGAKAVAKRIFGKDNEEVIRTVYYLAGEKRHGKPSKPILPFLIRVGGRVSAWESRIRAHAQQSGQS